MPKPEQKHFPEPPHPRRPAPAPREGAIETNNSPFPLEITPVQPDQRGVQPNNS